MLLRILTVLALAGLVGSIVFQALVISGIRAPSTLIVGLHIGIFLLGAFYVAFSFAIRMDDGDWWYPDPMAMLHGCPFWLRATSIIVIACVGAAAVIGQRFETAIYAVMYVVLFTGFYSLMRQPWRLTGLVCPNGHPASYRNRFCKTCGIPMPKPVADD